MRGVAHALMAKKQIVPDPEISIPVRPLRVVRIESLSVGRWAVCMFVLDRQDSGPSNHLQALRRARGSPEARRSEAQMETDPYYDAISAVVPIIVLVLLGALCIYSVIGVPVGIILIGVAVGMSIAYVMKRHHGAPGH